jgi:hypothetical protein
MMLIEPGRTFGDPSNHGWGDNYAAGGQTDAYLQIAATEFGMNLRLNQTWPVE